MKLIVDTSSIVQERKFQAAFQIMTPLLGIDRAPQSVWLRFIHQRATTRVVGTQVEVGHLGGATYNVVEDGIVQMVLNEWENTCKCIECTNTAANKEKLAVFAHEMVHVKQIVKGELVGNNYGIYWRGRFIDERNIPRYEDQPWEHEANIVGDQLYARVKAVLAQHKETV